MKKIIIALAIVVTVCLSGCASEIVRIDKDGYPIGTRYDTIYVK